MKNFFAEKEPKIKNLLHHFTVKKPCLYAFLYYIIYVKYFFKCAVKSKAFLSPTNS